MFSDCMWYRIYITRPKATFITGHKDPAVAYVCNINDEWSVLTRPRAKYVYSKAWTKKTILQYLYLYSMQRSPNYSVTTIETLVVTSWHISIATRYNSPWIWRQFDVFIDFFFQIGLLIRSKYVFWIWRTQYIICQHVSVLSNSVLCLYCYRFFLPFALHESRIRYRDLKGVSV